MTMLRLGPPRLFRPICIRQACGFIGSPAGYVEVGPDQAHTGPLIVDARAADARIPISLDFSKLAYLTDRGPRKRCKVESYSPCHSIFGRPP